MLRNEQGSLLVDALMGLLLTCFMVFLLVNAYGIWAKTTKMERVENGYELYETGTRIYDD